MEYYSKNVSLVVVIIPCILALLFGVATCDIEKDKEKCANQLVGAATCLPYVSGEANVPPMDCCTGFNQIVKNSPECICLLVKDRNDPSLGLQINATRALSLPTLCKSTVNLTVSDSLLHLPPNSPDAKVFEDFANSAKNNTTTTPAAVSPCFKIKGISSGGTTTTTANQRSDGGEIKRWIGTEIVSGLLLAIVAAVQILPNL
ncbi:hypothetical protein DH2020_021927 [Rehmannia glutinosa]|uniref:Bifunctional inhibitor/plant lipid transfer protein/seed storage helical domain-containing protein n=1 Tax=Rehmannia glutinosa TaxID=99300 RepID=A0ABR0WFN1_REHGL